jgi:hypothetical protein
VHSGIQVQVQRRHLPDALTTAVQHRAPDNAGMKGLSGFLCEGTG